jgi:hypothetical protein
MGASNDKLFNFLGIGKRPPAATDPYADKSVDGQVKVPYRNVFKKASKGRETWRKSGAGL